MAGEMLRTEAQLQARAVAAAAKTIASDPDDPAYKPVDAPRASDLVLQKVGGDTDPKTKRESNLSGDTYLQDCPSEDDKHLTTGIRGKPWLESGEPVEAS